MELSIQERLKDLRVERGLTLEQLEEQVNLSKSALGVVRQIRCTSSMQIRCI